MKKIISIFLSFSIIFSCCLCAYSDELESTDTRFSVKIVHTNDIHARVKEDDWNGIIGVAKLKTIIDNHILNSDMSFVLDSGDLYHGQSIATLVEGESVAQLIGACGYDAMTAGNHDWNYGKDRLKELVNITDEFDERDFKLLAGNVVNDDSSRFFDDEFLIKSVEKDGKELKIGIFGMIDPLIYDSTSPKNVAGLTFTDMEVYAKKAVENLKSEGCQFIIALTHSYAPVELAAKIDGVDLWLTGHEHISINQTVMTPSGKETLVIENGYYLYEVGLLSIDIILNDNDEVTDISYTTDSTDYSDSAEITPDNDVLNMLDSIDSRQAEILDKVVGSSPVDLDGVWENLRIDETTMGRAVTDAYLFETGADVAFENAGGIRSSINAGNVTYGDIINVLPYGNYIVTKEVTGAELWEILETSIDIQIKNIAANDSGLYDAWPGNSGSYLQVGGMTVKYNCSNEYGNRVVSVLVGGTPLEADRLYTVATNNFVAVSADFPQLAAKKEINEYSACDEAFITFFKQNDDTVLNSVSTERMIQTSASESEDNNESSEQTKPAESKEESQMTESAGMQDNQTDATVLPTNEDTSQVSSNAVATGDNADGYMVIIIAMAAMVFIFVSCKNKNLKTNSD